MDLLQVIVAIGEDDGLSGSGGCQRGFRLIGRRNGPDAVPGICRSSPQSHNDRRRNDGG
jgi:hypothetical protein